MKRSIMSEDMKKLKTHLRSGYTTGSCAAAAARAAAGRLLGGAETEMVQLMTPAGKRIPIRICYTEEKNGTVSCGVRKDSGDDPDVTDGMMVCADVRITKEPGVHLDGGEGVGRVTKPGLDQPVGRAAINSTPRRMIEGEIRKAAEEAGFSLDTAGVEVIIRIPEGEALAKKTFNPRLGIVGGLSVLGTTGIVEPMSEKALLATIRTEVSVRRAEGYRAVCAAPGNYGMHFLEETYGFPPDLAVTASNYIWDTVQYVREAGFTRMLLAGHIGKLIKVAGGVKNTHSQYGDRRMENLGDLAEEAAGEECAAPVRKALAESVMTDDAIRVLDEAGIREPVMKLAVSRIQAVCEDWVRQTGGGTPLQVEVVMFSNVYGLLAMTDKAEDLIWFILSERDRVRRISLQSEDRSCSEKQTP